MLLFNVESQGRTSGSSESEYLVPSKKVCYPTLLAGSVSQAHSQPNCAYSRYGLDGNVVLATSGYDHGDANPFGAVGDPGFRGLF